MSNRILVAGVIVLLLAVGAWYVVVVRGVGLPPAPSAEPPVEQVPPPEPSPIQPAPVPVAPGVPPAAEPERAARVAALTFAERYGTYSSDAPFANLTRLAPIVTSSFAAALQLQATGSPPGAGGFYGVTTRALSGEVAALGELGATVRVTVQRQEQFTRGGEARLSYQALVVTLQREAGEWLVAGARWEE